MQLSLTILMHAAFLCLFLNVRVNVALAGPSLPLAHWRDNMPSTLGNWCLFLSNS